MTQNHNKSLSWSGDWLAADVLHSSAGLAHQIIVNSKNHMFLFDCGDGTLRDLIIREINPREIEAIFITHGHFDHIGGLWSILGFLRMVGRKKELQIILPRDCKEPISIIEVFKARYEGSISFEINIIEADPNQTFEIGDSKIKTFAVSHSGSIAGSSILAPIPAFGYRIESNSESVAISSDTGDCDGLREMVKDADLALIEATFGKSTSVTDEQLKQVHLSEELAHEIGKLAKDYILVHKGRR